MKAWYFSTDAHPPAERFAAWRDAMARLGLPVGGSPGADACGASVVCLTSSMGMEFALVEADAQSISGRKTDQPAAVWLVVLLDGQATLLADTLTETLTAGEIVYGPTGREATLRLETRCRLMFVKAPRVALAHRLISPMTLGVGRLRAHAGVAHIFSGLLRATADELESLTTDQLRPVELALTEFLSASIAELSAQNGCGQVSTAHEARLHRIRQTIEGLLPDMNLSLKRVAEADGVSPRYVQKLFNEQNDSFSHYVRFRRLERCRTDLASPQYAGLSISAICFRWGFNGSAHFSRAFRNQYGVTPREHRLNAGADLVAAE